MKFSRRVFRSLVLSLVLITFSAQAVVPALPAGERYLQSCEGLIASAESQTPMEKYLAENAETEGQKLQLLEDYGVFFTKEFTQAMGLVLADRGLIVDMNKMEKHSQKDAPWHQKLKLNEVKRYVLAMEQFLSLSDEEFDKIVDEVLKTMKDRVSGMEDQALGQVLHLQLTQLFDEVLKGDNEPEFRRLLRTGIRALIASTVRDLAGKVFNRQLGNLKRRYGKLSWWYGGTYIFNMLGGIIFTDYLLRSLLGVQLGINEALWYFFASPFVWGAGWLTLPRINKINNQFLKIWRKWGKQAPQSVRLTAPKGEAVDVEFANYIHSYTDTIADRVLSLEQACDVEDLCELSPPQLAYIGHIDILRLQELAAHLGKSVEATRFQERLKEIQGIATELKKTPEKKKLQYQMLRRIQNFVSDFENSAVNLEQAVTDLKEKTEEIQGHLEELASRPFEYDPEEHSRDLDDHNEFLMAKMDTDLETLRQIQVDQEIILAQVKALGPTVEGLKTLIPDLRNKDVDWKAQAGEISLLMDQMQLEGGQ